MDIVSLATLIAQGEAARDAQDQLIPGYHPFSDFKARLGVKESEIWAWYERCRNRAAADLAHITASQLN